MTWRSGLMATTTICGTVLAGAAAPALVAGLLTLAPTAAQAQDYTNGSLAGTVKSEGGKAEAGATVSVKGVSNAYKKTITTGADGKFELNQIPTGKYDIDISSPDGTKAKESITVSLGSVSSYDFTTSAASETVVVVKGKARRNIDFNRTTTGQVIDVQQTLDRVPVGRDLTSIADLVPGISVNTSFGTPVKPYASLSGASPAENIYYVDGMNVTNFRNFLGGSDVPIDFYDQIEVKTGGYSAEFGRNTGGAFIATTRSGSDTFHGGVSVSYAPEGLSSKSDVFAVDLNSAGLTYSKGYKKQGTQSEQTVWLSGPLWKNHVYFFGLYNPRSFTDSDYRLDSTGKISQVTTNKTSDAPFYGGKLTLMLNPDQRLDVTYFKDDQVPLSDQNDIAGGIDTPSYQGQGGLTRIFKYTGKFTDWFSLTALYGYSGFNQTSFSSADSQAAVFDNGSVVRGNPNLTIETGRDTRKNYRIDADFYYNLLGRHHTRVGGDLELLNAVDFQQYSGGVYYRYYGPATNCGSSGTITDSCVRVRTLFNGGSFNVHNRSYYVQDDWTLTDRWNLNLGVRSDTFDNRNAGNVSFLKNKNLISPRLGVSYDLWGDKSTKLTGFFGRFYIPIAANTNIREAGGETFLEDYYTYSSRNSTTLVPVLGTKLVHNVLSNGAIPAGDELASKNLSAQYEDSYMVGYESHLSSGWRIGVHATYNKLYDAMEDTNLRYGKTSVCTYLNIPAANCGGTPPGINFGSSGYVLVNPGKDVVVTLGSAFGAPYAGKVVTIPNSVLGLPVAKREYTALEFDFERPDDGKWYMQGSVTLSKTEGNIEGGVKSDNGQTDTGLTQDFDENGWTDGNFGLLPNHHALSIKAYGLYHINDKLTASFNAAILSPRHYGCIGYYPSTDGRADSTTLTAWYCNKKLTPRGSQFKGDWINKLDLSLAYTDPLPVGAVRYQVDVFNILNAQGASQMGEFGEIGGVATLNKNYKQPLAYQTPRWVRFSVKYQF